MGTTGSSLFGSKPSDLGIKREEIFREEELALIQKSLDNCQACHCSESKCDDHFDETDTAGNQHDARMYQYPFENLIFEGGGNKGMAYCGALKYLEEMNILPQIKRFGGTSCGAITAALVAMGYNHSEIENFLADDVEKTFLDHSYGYFSLLPNLIKGWGWNPGMRIYQWFGDKIEAKMGNPDLTFYELYKMKGTELCVVVTNLNQMRAEYCHPKTTPNMFIREALRMSMSVPVVFMACVHDNNGLKDTYVDGGVLCNYPIQCFDGWYLSMEKKDSFLLKMQNLDDMSQLFSIRYMFEHDNHYNGSVNQKTIGFLLYEDTEVELMRENLDQRKGAATPSKPSRHTTLYQKKLRAKTAQNSLKAERYLCLRAAESFMKALLKYNIEDDVYIDKGELIKAMQDESVFSAADKEKLFGKGVTVDEAFNYLDKDGNGQIDFQELLRFLEKRNVGMQNRIQGYNRTEIHNLIDFGSALQNSWTVNMKYVYVGKEDIKRTVGINTGHVGTSDYNLEKEDREFLVNRGYNAAAAFLQSYITDNAERMVKVVTSDATDSKSE